MVYIIKKDGTKEEFDARFARAPKNTFPMR